MMTDAVGQKASSHNPITLIKKPFQKFLDPKTQISKHGKWFAIAPAAILLVGIIVFAFFNFNLGLDFTAGRIIKVTGITSTNYSEARAVVRDVLEEELGRSTANKASFQREVADISGVSLTVRYQEPKKKTESELKTINDTITNKIETRLAEEGHSVIIEESTTISASASAERLRNVFIAVFAALVGILLYMFFRFSFTSGVAAVIGLFHDVMIMVACVAIFRIQVNFIFVAAIITVVAYSLNNTLVLFDRVRDKEKDVSNTQTVSEKVDSSIKETFWRTLITTITTLVPVVVLTIFGVPLIREFALPIIFGLLAGTYSTMCITSSLYVRFETAKLANAKRKKKVAQHVKAN